MFGEKHIQPPSQQNSNSRLISVDALRGFDMFWIIGGDLVIRSLPKIHSSALTRFLATQMDHCEWAGFHFYDLIFPLFVFIVGVSLVFSVSRMVERAGRPAAIKRIIVRSVILFLLGIFYMGGVAAGVKNVYLAGVLHRIAVAYFFAALIFCFLGCSPSPSKERAGERLRAPGATKGCLPRFAEGQTTIPPLPGGEGRGEGESRGYPRPLPTPSSEIRSEAMWQPRNGLYTMIALCFLLLVGYWALMTFVSVPGIGTPSLDQPGKNLAHYLDELYLPGQRFEGTLLSTMAAVANCLLGVFAGLLLKASKISAQQKVYWLVGSGAASLLLGFAWSLQFPIIKLLWTSTYVLVACGYGAILLGIFYQIIELWGFQKWARPFVWIGMNAITIYLVGNIANLHRLALRFVGGDIKILLGNYSDLAAALVGLALALWLVNFLYRRNIFLRL